MLACTALVGCTNEDVIDNPNENPVLNGDKAYMAINIVSANGTASRGEGDNGNPFAEGDATEHAVNNVHFYFYDNSGNYWGYSPETTTWSDDDNTTNDNDELLGQHVAVLEGLAGKSLPNYVVAVLNVQESVATSLKGKTLTQMQKELINGYADNGFTMTNSTHNCTNVGGTGSFATKVTENHFLTETPSKTELTADNAVTIYVERLAAKAKLTIATTTENEISVNNGVYSITLGKYSVDGEQKDLTINISRWGINGTNKKSHLMKNVPTSWTDMPAATDYSKTTNNSLPAWKWDDGSTNHRSYWAYSWNYNNNEATYPDDATDFTKDENDEYVADNFALNYYSWNQLSEGEDSKGAAITGSLYCAENTNTPALLATNFNAKTTQVLIQAQLNGGEDLIRYENMLWTKEGYIARVLTNAGLSGKLLKYSEYADEQGAHAWRSKEIEASDFEYVNLGNGNVTVRFKDVVRDEDGTIESVLPTKSGDQNEYKWYDAQYKDGITVGGENATPTIDIETLNEYEIEIKEIAEGAECYKDGMMYYNIPIEHLRGGKFGYVQTGEGASATTTIGVNEADYGVVRNHWYNISVNSIANLGTAVFDANEKIIPNDDDKITYYVGAQIYILSWKIVNQGVDL